VSLVSLVKCRKLAKFYTEISKIWKTCILLETLETQNPDVSGILEITYHFTTFVFFAPNLGVSSNFFLLKTLFLRSSLLCCSLYIFVPMSQRFFFKTFFVFSLFFCVLCGVFHMVIGIANFLLFFWLFAVFLFMFRGFSLFQGSTLHFFYFYLLLLLFFFLRVLRKLFKGAQYGLSLFFDTSRFLRKLFQGCAVWLVTFFDTSAFCENFSRMRSMACHFFDIFAKFL